MDKRPSQSNIDGVDVYDDPSLIRRVPMDLIRNFGYTEEDHRVIKALADEIDRLRAIEAEHGKCICGHDLCGHNTINGKADGFESCDECDNTAHRLSES